MIIDSVKINEGNCLGYPYSCGIEDGTLFPLQFKRVVYQEEYLTRKGSYDHFAYLLESR